MPDAPVPTVVCAECHGSTVLLRQCPCLSDGEQFVTWHDGSGRRPLRDCELCQGRGSVAHACHACGQYGRRRGQLVLTVANLDTGSVASLNVVPGVVEPRPTPGGGWHLALTPLVRELAASVGAGDSHHVSAPRKPVAEQFVALPLAWRPELPVGARHALEAGAIAGHTRTPWQVYLGRTTARPAPDPDRELARLCVIADLLCLDLVVEARRPSHGGGLGWEVRYELPGSAPPQRPAAFRDLRQAVAATSVENAVALLAARQVTAPAHFVVPTVPAGAGPSRRLPEVDLDQVERRVVASCTNPATGEENAGAQAIWRERAWWYTGLRPAGLVEALETRDTGRPVRRITATVLRAWEPPAPSWRGEAIPHCHACGDSHRRYLGVVVTISDLRDWVIHLILRVGDKPPAPQVATQPGGMPVVQLPDRYRLERWASAFGVRPGDLADLDGGGPVDQDLREGIVTLPRLDADPVTQYVANAGRGHPGARRFIRAGRPEVPALADLIRLALGLGLAITVTVQDHRLNDGDPLRVHGEGWDVEIANAALPVAALDPPLHPTAEAAIAHCLDYLDVALAEVVPADPSQPIRVPRTPEPAPGLALVPHTDTDADTADADTAADDTAADDTAADDTAAADDTDALPSDEDPVRLIRQLGDRYAGQPVAVRFDQDGCHLYLLGRRPPRHLASAATVQVAFATLTTPTARPCQ